MSLIVAPGPGRACAARHPEGGAEYGKGKSDWIDQAEAQALAHLP